MRKILGFIVMVLTFASNAPAFAQPTDAYPSKPVRIVIAAPAGGSTVLAPTEN